MSSQEKMLSKRELPSIRKAEIRLKTIELSFGRPLYVRVRYEALRRFFVAHPAGYAWYIDEPRDLFKATNTVTIFTISSATPEGRETMDGATLG